MKDLVLDIERIKTII